MDGTAGGLATLTLRPPTPPHEANSLKDVVFPDNTTFSKHFVRSPLDTPEESPSSSADYLSRSSERLLKRVDFLSDHSDLLTEASRSIIAIGKDVRALPPSKDCKPLKSILKPYKYDYPSEPESRLREHTTRSFPRMLEDVIRELTSSSRSSRLDAYQTLNGCLKTYDDIPNPEALIDKIPLLTDFICRDLSSDASEKVGLDTQLVTQVLKLVTILLWTPKSADMLQDDFRIFILNQSIDVIGHSSSSKTIVNHYMHLIATQKFSLRIMNNDRANRLLNVLGEITGNVKGNGVVGQRLMIYRTLLTQANALMVSRVSDWIDHLFSGMLSNIKEVRSRALAFGLDASVTWGTTSQVARSVLDIFNRQSPEGKKFLDVLIHRLNDMLKSKDEGVHVPQIWSVVILFLRSRRSQLEHWEYMKDWLVIIQKCFNSTDNLVKFQAHISWNRLILAISPTVSTGSSMVKMLRQPIIAQLDRKSSDKHSKQAKQIAYSTYCTLIYYSLRPGSSHDSLDRFWGEYITPLLIKTDAKFACEILSFLLGDSHQTTWAETRTVDGQPIKPEELARLDPQWVRAKSATVLKVLEPLLLTTDWNLSDGCQSWALHAWHGFTKALSDAGSKEVKVSTETLSAMANMLNSIKSVSMLKPDKSSSNTSIGLQRLATLVKIAVENLGSIPFAEKRIIRNPGYSFEAAGTPSSRAPRAQGFLASPMIHLIGMILNCSQDANKEYEDILRDFIHIALRSATSRHSKLKVMREVAHLTSSDLLAADDANNCLWTVILEVLVALTPTSRSNETTADSPQQAGQDYREIIKILELEVQSSTTMKSNWAATFEHINVQVQRECGVAASILAIIEPFAAFLQRVSSKPYDRKTVQQITILVRNAKWLDSRKELERAQKALWGLGSVSIRSSSFSAYNDLYALLDDVLSILYASFNPQNYEDIAHLFQAMRSFIGSCPISASAMLLKPISIGLAHWIEDAEGHMNSEDRSSQSLFMAVSQTWITISHLTSNLPRFDTHLLLLLEPLIQASLSSRHRAVVNTAIDLWNRTFGLAKDLEYPPAIVIALRRLSLVADILTPGLINNGDDCIEYDSTPFDFIETPEGLEQKSASGNDCSHDLVKKLQRKSIEYREEVTKSCPEPLSIVAKCTSTPPPRRQFMTGTPMARLRHNDSQIQFAAIESSPSCSEAMESQFLTERQREVKKRQHEEAAAMFPDIRSSPRRKSRDGETTLSRLHLGLNRDIRNRNLVEEIVSPTLPPPDDLSNTFLDSSPTPSSSAKRSRRFFYQDGPPSSPPLPEHKGAKEMDLPSNPQHLQDVVDEMQAEPITNPQELSRQEERTCNAYLTEIGPGTEVFRSDTKVLQERRPEFPHVTSDDAQISRGVQKLQDCSPNASEHDATEVQQQSPQLHKVEEDRPASRRGISPNKIAQSSEIIKNAVENMNQSKYHDISIDSDDEVSAQIANDMERALSQAAESSKASSPLDSRDQADSTKRKRLSISPEPSTKRRCSSRLSDSAGISRMKKAQSTADEEILECIVVSSPGIQSEADTGDDSGLAAHISVTRGQYRISKRAIPKKKGRPQNSVRDIAVLCESDVAVEALIGFDRALERPQQSPGTEREPGRRHPEVDAPSSTSCSSNKPGVVVSPQSIQFASTGAIAEYRQHDSQTASTASYRNTDVGNPLEMARRANRSHLMDRKSESGDLESEAIPGSLLLNSPNAVGPSPALSSPHITKHRSILSFADSGHVATTSNKSVSTTVGQGEGQPKATDILEKLKTMLAEAKEAVLQTSEGREIISAWMDLGRELQDAERRGAT